MTEIIQPTEGTLGTPPQKVNIVLDASKIDSFETCPAKYNFRHNLNRTLPLLYKSKALDLGSLAHSGLEIYYNMLKEQKSWAERIEAAMTKIRELSSDPTQSNSEPDEVNHLCTAVEESCDHFRAEDENSLEVLAVEQPFAYVLFEDNYLRIIISGKIDLLVNYKGIGRAASYNRLPIDHKTFSRESMLLRKSNQFINYCAAVESNYLVVNRIGLQKTKSQEDRFKRLPLSYDPVYIQAWKDNLITMLTNEYLTCVANQSWPEKITSCNKFNRLCEYYAICDSSGQDAKDNKLENEYIDGEVWDVTRNLTSEAG